VKLNRAGSKKIRDVPTNWKTPDIYAPDKLGRDRVWALLETYSTRNLSPEAVFVLISQVATRLNLKPAVVLSTWRSLKKEHENAGR